MTKDEVHAVCQQATSTDPPKMVAIIYDPLYEGRSAERNIEPYSFRWQSNKDLDEHFWYLYGYETDPAMASVSGKSGIKAFLVELIEAARIIDRPFVPRWPLEF